MRLAPLALLPLLLASAPALAAEGSEIEKTTILVAAYNHNEHVVKGITETGEVPFVIHLKNELLGADEVVFKGKANVKKFHVNGAAPKFKNTFYYYVDEDWRLPVGLLWWNTKEDAEAPPLMAAVWVRGAITNKD